MIKYRYFFGFLNLEKKWLNSMAHKGWQLEKLNHNKYEFIESFEEYRYDIDILWNKSIDETNDYIAFLHEMGHRTFRDSLNLNFSLARIKLRAGRGFFGHFDSSRGNLNKEILIVEKQSETPLYTTGDDLYQYYKNKRNMYLFPTLLGGGAMLDSFSTKLLFEVHNKLEWVFALVITMIFAIPLIIFQLEMFFVKNKRQIEEK